MKFAYLIMAHNNPRQLNMLLELLDYEDNEMITLNTNDNKTMLVTIDNKEKLLSILHDVRELNLTDKTIFETLLQDYVHAYNSSFGMQLVELVQKYVDFYNNMQYVDHMGCIDTINKQFIEFIIDFIDNNIE